MEVVGTDVFPRQTDQFRAALKTDIATRASQGTRFFSLVGDANDHREFRGELAGGLWFEGVGWEHVLMGYGDYVDQSARDRIPTFYEFDPLTPPNQSIGYYTPYFASDLPYADTDDNGVPDVVLTRLPVTTVDEVANYAMKLWMSSSNYYGASSVTVLRGNQSHDAPGVLVDYAADVVEQAITSTGTQVHSLAETEYPLARERNTAVADLINYEQSELIAILGGFSNRSYPGNFMDQTDFVNPWQADTLHDVHTFIGGSCGGADFARTEDPEFGPPVAEKSLLYPWGGARTWVGPTAGSDYRANRVIVAYLIEELLANPERSVAESFLVSQQRIFQDFAGDEQVLATARAYVVLGGPFSQVMRAPIATNVAGGASAPSLL